MVTIAINGAAGKMGRRLVALASTDPDLTVLAAIERSKHELLGHDSGQLAGVDPNSIPLADTLKAQPQVLIDFTDPDGTRSALQLCTKQRCGMVIGTTSLSEQDLRTINLAAQKIPILQASNFSLVMTVLNQLATKAATLLGDDFDIEILEAHHRFKKDAPSGTALTLAQRICNATGRSFEKDVIFNRHGDHVPREDRQITIQALRIGDHVGEHTAFFAALGERLELRHVSTNRDSYARNALRAARWLSHKKPGRYTIEDMLGMA